MCAIDILIIVLVIITLTITLYSINQHKVFLNKMNQYWETVEEAERVQKELENLMEQAVAVSRQLVEDVDIKYRSVECTPAEETQDEFDAKRTELETAAASGNYDSGDQNVNDKVPDLSQMNCREAGLLREQGWSTREIAQKLNKGQDEIDLMLNLYDFSIR